MPISCILALCVGELCHCIFYHDLARLTIYGTTAKWSICISRHWYIFHRAASATLRRKKTEVSKVSFSASMAPTVEGG